MSISNIQAKIEGDLLFYKGKYYKILDIGKDVIFVDSTDLFGKVGDEFPLRLLSTTKNIKIQ